MQQDDEFPGVTFRIDGNSLFVASTRVPGDDREMITRELAAKLFDYGDVKVTILPEKHTG